MIFIQGFERLEAREQRFILLGMFVVALTTGYFMGWEPFQQAYKELSGRVRAQQETLAWMQQAS
ncbi:MAG: hypothetical protein BWK79_02985, partial [Beggiatoa sp. IS2]